MDSMDFMPFTAIQGLKKIFVTINYKFDDDCDNDFYMKYLKNVSQWEDRDKNNEIYLCSFVNVIFSGFDDEVQLRDTGCLGREVYGIDGFNEIEYKFDGVIFPYQLDSLFIFSQEKQISKKNLSRMENKIEITNFREYQSCSFYEQKRNSIEYCYFENCSFRTEIYLEKIENCIFKNCNFVKISAKECSNNKILEQCYGEINIANSY